MCLVPAPGEFWASRNDLSNFEKMSADACGVFVTSFAKNESLYRRISTKYKSSKLFWRILEDNKQNKRENRGKKTVWILRADSRFAWVWSTCCWNAMNSFPFGLRFAFCRQILAYFDELYQQIHGCLSLTRYFDGNRKKQSVCVMSTLYHDGRRSIEFHYANYDNPISIIW